jgi:chemotaxis protein CheX
MISAKLSRESKPDRAQREQWLPVLDLATREVFEIMLASKLKPALPEDAARPFDVTAMVGLAGGMCGVVTFRCGFRAATRLACKMLSREISEDDEQAGDAVGEICNMIAGNFKSKITGLKEECVLSPPTVVTGANYRVHSLAAQCLEIVLLFEGLPISVALELRT